MLIETAKVLMSKNATIKISDYKNNQRGGDLAKVIQLENDNEKTRGGIILPKAKKESEEKIVGKYIKTEETYKILDNCVKKVEELSKLEGPTNKKEVQRDTSIIIENNKDDVLKILEDSAKCLQELQTIKRVKKKNIYLGAYRAAIIGLSAGLLAAFTNKEETTTVAIQACEIENYDISNEIEYESNDVKDMIGNNYIYENGKLQEAQTLGKIDANVEVEVEARENRIKNMISFDEIQQNIDDLQIQYFTISEPTNIEWLEYQIDSLKQYNYILELHDKVTDQGIEHIDKWNEYNQEHINKGNFSEETKLEHEMEISYNTDEKEEYLATKKEIKEKKEMNDDRENFYKAFSRIENVEKVKDIASTTEKIFDFSKSDIGQELGNNKLFKMLEEKNINLFANFSDQNIKVDNLNEFLETYEKIEYSFETYVKQYCNGNSEQADENKYIQYIEGVRNKGELDKVGEKDFFNNIGGILQIDKLNKGYYSDYGKDDVIETKRDAIDRLQNFIRKSFDTAKIEDYEKMMKKIKDLDNSKDNKDKGDLEYGEIDN